MKKIHALALALAIAATASVAAQRTMAQGQEGARIMEGTEILETASGNTTVGVFTDRAVSFAVYLAPNGVMIGRISDENGDRLERGSWRVENDKLYGRWDNLRGGAWNAFEYRVAGDNIHAYRQDGTLDRIQYYVEGDPLGLQAAAETTTALVPSDDGSTPDFARIIREHYFAQWRNTAEHPFSMEIARRLYLTDDRLTALDADAAAVEDADSRLEGWSEYAPVWPAAFETIKRFEAREVRDLLVRREGDWALVTFDMAGEAELETGETLDIFKHFTLVWIDTGDGWRIMHEHISDGQPAK